MFDIYHFYEPGKNDFKTKYGSPAINLLPGDHATHIEGVIAANRDINRGRYIASWDYFTNYGANYYSYQWSNVFTKTC